MNLVKYLQTLHVINVRNLFTKMIYKKIYEEKLLINIYNTMHLMREIEFAELSRFLENI